MGSIGLVSGLLGLGSLAFLFYLLLGVGFATTFFAGIPWWVALVIIGGLFAWLLTRK